MSKAHNKAEGLGNKFLSHIRETNAIIHIVRCFKSAEIIHIENEVNPFKGDLEIINTELILKRFGNYWEKIYQSRKEIRTGDKQKLKDLEILKIIKENLNKNILAINLRNRRRAAAKAIKFINR